MNDVGCFVVWVLLGLVLWVGVLHRRLGDLRRRFEEMRRRLDHGSAALHQEAGAAAPATITPPPPPVVRAEPDAARTLRPVAASAPLEASLAAGTPSPRPVPAAEPPALLVTPAPAPRIAADVPVDLPDPTGRPAAAAYAPEPSAPRDPIDWEKWLGIRGAAALGGMVLALAGILFVKYAIDRGWLDPATRIVLAHLAGVATLATGALLERRQRQPTAHALFGSGVAILYAASWAGHSLYHLMSLPVALASLSLTTTAGGFLAWRLRSQVIAYLGLVGGFATPLLLTSTWHQPIGLFGYLMLLNVGLALVGARLPGNLMVALAQIATFLYQAAWVLSEVTALRFGAGLGWLTGFAVLFLALATRNAGSQRLRTLGALVPLFGFAFYVVLRADLWRAWPQVALAIGVPTALGLVLSVVRRRPALALAAALADLAIVTAWAVRSFLAAALDRGSLSADQLASPIEWQWALLTLALAVLFALREEWVRRSARAGSADPLLGRGAPAAVFAGGALVFVTLVQVALGAFSFWSWATLVLVLTLILVRVSTERSPSAAVVRLPAVAAFFGALGTARVLASGAHGSLPGATPGPLVLAAFAVGAAAAWLLREEWQHGRGRSADGSTATFAGTVLLLVSALQLLFGTWAFSTQLVVSLGLALVLLRLAARLLQPLWGTFAASCLGVGLLRALFGAPLAGREPETALVHWIAIALALGLAAFLLRLPRGGWFADLGAAILPLIALVPANRHLDAGLGHGFLAGLLALVLAVATLRQRPSLFLLALPLSVANGFAFAEWFTVGPPRLPTLLYQLAITGLVTVWPAVAARRFLLEDPSLAAHQARGAFAASALAPVLWFPLLHSTWLATLGPRAIGALPASLAALLVGCLRLLPPASTTGGREGRTALAAVAVGLVTIALPLQFDREWLTVAWSLEALGLFVLARRFATPWMRWAACALHATVAVRLLLNPAVLSYHPVAGVPILNWLLIAYLVPAASLLASAVLLDRRPPDGTGRLPRTALGATALLVVFAWISLTVIDAFSPPGPLHITFTRLPARDLALSLAWVLYALGLLWLGVARRTMGLRWGSLAVLLVAILKVFLHDLGELEDLYRVASLVGLAVTLLLVSLLYQRFVLREVARDGDDSP